MAVMAVVAILAALGLGAADASAATAPPLGSSYTDGPSGRYQMNGSDWLFRADPHDAGVKQGFFNDTGTAGWSPVAVPNAWNLTDSAVSYDGEPVWYRK